MPATLPDQDNRQITLFAPQGRALPVLGAQGDIVYIEHSARTAMNAPEATGMDYWSINPYIGCAFGCAYCYARYAHQYAMERAIDRARMHPEIEREVAEMPPWLAFERRVFVKRDIVSALQRALRHGSARHLGLIQGEAILIGTATDPYQPAERRFRITRSILEVLAEHSGMRIGIITKSPLIARDVHLLARIARHSRLRIHVSLITVDRALARQLEPRAPTPSARLRAVTRLRDAGLDVGVNIMPVLPGITDDGVALEALVRQVAAAGATHVNVGPLRLQSAARRRYLPFVEQAFPKLAGRYRATYAQSDHVSERYQRELQQQLRVICDSHGIRLGAGRNERDAIGPAGQEPQNEQLGLQLLLPSPRDSRPGPLA